MFKELCRSFRGVAKLGTFAVLMGLTGLSFSSPTFAQTSPVIRKFDFADDSYLSGVSYGSDSPYRAFRRFSMPATEDGLTAYFTAWDSPVADGNRSQISLDVYTPNALPHGSTSTGAVNLGMSALSPSRDTRPDHEYSLQSGLASTIMFGTDNRICELDFYTPHNFKGLPYTTCNTFDFKVLWGGGGYIRHSPLPNAPDIVDVNPAHGQTIVSWPKWTDYSGITHDVVEGYAKDLNGSGVASVYLVLKRDSDGAFWNGTEWTFNKDKLDCGVAVSSRAYSGYPYYFFRRIDGLPVGANLLNGTYTLIVNAKDGKSQLTEYTSKIRVLHP